MTYHWDAIGCFIWYLFETSRRHTDGTSLLRPFETLSRRSIRWGDVPPRRHWVFHLWRTMHRHWDVQRDGFTTSPGRLVARREAFQSCKRWMPPCKERKSSLDKCLSPYLNIIYQRPIKYPLRYPPLSTYKMGVQV